MTRDDLCQALESRQATVAVVGLGYVGIPAAVLLAEAGFSVIGFDLDPRRVEALAGAQNPLEGDEPGLPELIESAVGSRRLKTTMQASDLSQAQVVLICVDTPVAADHKPHYEALRSASTSVGSVLQAGALVVVESTISPGTMTDVVRPALEAASGLVAGRDFCLGHCPERVMPGRLLLNMRTMSRVLGADSPETAELMRALYSTYVDGALDTTDLLTAELVKVAENAYRDVNIAFANQLALICEAAGGDVWRVRELVNKSPGRNVLLPGAGVGGHCIPKDPWLLAAGLGDPAGAPLVAAAREINDGMPAHVAGMVAGILAGADVEIGEAEVAVLGYSYLENSGDTRNSPSAALVERLEALGARVRLHDPFVAGLGGDPLDAARDADCCVVMVAHAAYADLDLAALASAMRRPLLIEGRALYEPAALAAAGFGHWRVGAQPVRGKVPVRQPPP